MDREEIKDEIRKEVKWSNFSSGSPTGQSVGLPQRVEVLKSEELELKIELGYHRSRFKNRELIYELFELVLDELIK